jgi:thiol-disulfide isomerase/thioredoxin
MKLSLLAVLLFGLLAPSAQARRAPNFEFRDLTGNKHKVAELRGSIVVLNFWATWCAPCREELPLLSRLTQEYAARKVRFIAVSADKSKDRILVDKFLGRQPLAMDIWVGADPDQLENEGLGNMLPVTIILDEQGEVVTRIMGQAREEDVTTSLNWLLNGKTGPAPAALTKRY